MKAIPQILFLFIGIGFFGLPHAHTQIITGRIIDQQSGDPIFNAFIFIDNSSIGTTSELDGSFELDLKGLSANQVIISHLYYKRIPLNSIPNWQNGQTIALTPDNILLDEVLVDSQKSPKRKKWLQQFKNYFFGVTSNRSSTRLVNPQVLLFQEDERGLTAQATDHLIIENTALGYRIRFFLDTFVLSPDDVVRYAGKVFFEDVVEENDTEEGIQARRIYTYNDSKQAFFRELTNTGTVDKSAYKVGYTTYTKRRKRPKFKSIKPSQILIGKGVRYDTVFMDADLTVRHIVRRNWRYGDPESRLSSKSGYLLIGPYGEIVNGYEVEEFGFWASKRVADLLPVDYNSEGIELPKPELLALPKAEELVDSLAAFMAQFPQEKAYIVLNKPYYSIRDTLWFKGFVVDASTHQPVSPSQVLHVDLIDPSGAIVTSRLLHGSKGFAGYFTIAPDQPAGQYQIRAYTDYMRSFDDCYFFRKRVPIYDYSVSSAAVSDTLLGSELAATKTHSPQLHFYPEGGDWVIHLPSNIAIQATDSEGHPFATKGIIENQAGTKVAEFQTTEEGLDMISLTPQPGQQYVAVVQKGLQSWRFPLPKALPTGYVLKVNASRPGHVIFAANATSALDLEGAFVVGHTRGKVFGWYTNLKPNAPVRIDRAALPEGVGHLTLFDAQGRPRAERLFYQAGEQETVTLDVFSNYQYYLTRQEVKLDLALPPGIEAPEWADLSVSVTDGNVVRYHDDAEDLHSYLHLNSDLDQPIPFPGRLLHDTGVQQLFWLDLYMMTRGWRRFNWQEALLPSQKELAYPASEGFTIEGYTTKKDSEDRVKSNLMLTALEPNFFVTQTTSDEQGHFRFTGLPMLDSTAFNLQGRIYQPGQGISSTLSLKGDKAIAFHLTPPEKPAIQLLPTLPIQATSDSTVLSFLNQSRREMLADSMYRVNWQIDLDEIVVKGRRIQQREIPSGAFDLNQADWIPPEQPAISLLARLRPSQTYRRDFSTGRLVFHGRDIRGGIVNTPVDIYINDLISSMAQFQSLTADMIDYIYFEGPQLYVFTRTNGPRSLQTKIQDGILNFNHPAYHQARTFSSPDYSTSKPAHQKPDLRTALFWTPKLDMGQSGRTTLSFYTADTPTRYRVRVEGLLADGRPISQTYWVEVQGQ